MFASAALALTVATAGSARGQDAATSGGVTSLDEVTVTARRTSENLQQTPIAVTAFTGDQLEKRAIRGLIEIQQQTPGLSAQPNQTAPDTVNFQIRGQYQVDSILVLDPPVGFYQDGVYTGTHVGSAITQLLDVERVEVLKGPQGTLYGRNTTGGAISIYTKNPTDELEGEVRAGIGNQDRYDVGGVLNLPIMPGTAALRLVAQKSWDGGYGENVLNGKSLGNPTRSYLRGTLKVNPTDSFEAIVRADYSHVRSDGMVAAPLYLQPGSPGQFAYGLLAGVAFPAVLGPTGDAAAQARLISFQSIPGYPYKVALNSQLRHFAEVWGTSATLSQEIGAATLKSITSYRAIKTDHPIDFDATSDPVFETQVFGTDSHLFTQEFQITGNTFDDRLKYVVGLFYIKSDGRDTSHSIAVPQLQFLRGGGPLPVVTRNVAHVVTESPAVFGQATFDLTETLHLTAGLRYTEEERSTTVTNNMFDPNTGATICNVPPPAGVGGAACRGTFKVSDDNISYALGLDWNITPDAMIYVRTARGFKSGGVNQRVSIDPASVSPFEAEIVTDYEIGAKTEFFDRRVRLNAAYFTSDYKNLQRAVFKLVGGTAASVVQNAGKATIQGVELDGQAVPVRNLNLRGTVAWTDAKYDVYRDALGTDLSHTKFPLLSRWTYSLSGAYTIETAVGDLGLQLDYSWRSSYSLNPLGVPQSLLQQKGYGLLNAGVSLDFAEQDLSIRGYVKNVTDKFFIESTFVTSAVPANRGLGMVNAQPTRGRTFGAEIVKRF